jgi:hypothetical protein
MKEYRTDETETEARRVEAETLTALKNKLLLVTTYK